MSIFKDRLPKLALALAILTGLTHPYAQAQSPGVGAAASTPLKLVVGFPPGGALDALARALAEQLRSVTGETVLVENRPGASTRLAIDYVKRAPADGKTVLLASTAPFIIFHSSLASAWSPPALTVRLSASCCGRNALSGGPSSRPLDSRAKSECRRLFRGDSPCAI
jgi:tripartite tricarboxylate transporter family receptor